MKNMKKLVAALLVMTMVVALASTAFAACIKKGMWVELKCDSAAYTAAKASKKTKSEARKGSTALCNKVCGNYARLVVDKEGAEAWFKTCDLKETDEEVTRVVWVKGGKGMSRCHKSSVTDPISYLKGKKIKVTGHTNLRKNCGMKFKSQGVVEKCDKLKLTGRIGWDTRDMMWLQVCYKGKKLWLSENFADVTEKMWEAIVEYYDNELE